MTVRFDRHAICLGLAAMLMAGCGGAQMGGTTVTIPQNAVLAADEAHVRSWMKSGASGADLLYASNGTAEDVLVFTYPEGELVGTLTGFDSPFGMCGDSAGNVWVVNEHPPEVIEYAHGGTTPIATLSIVGWPYGCAFDPTTGNLAVVGAQNVISIFPNAQGTPITYSAPDFYNFHFGGYDNRGNFFAAGYHGVYPLGAYALAELPKGGSDIIPVFYSQDIVASNAQWDGKYLAVGGEAANHQPVPVYRAKVSGAKAIIVSTTELTNLKEKKVWEQFWIQGNRIIQGSYNTRDISIWRYPEGGNPVTTIKLSRYTAILGVVVSAAPTGSRGRR